MKTTALLPGDDSEQALLTRELSEAASAYYNTGTAKMSDLEYDGKLEKLQAMERGSGIVYDISPTVRVGAEVVDVLKKDRHETPALSLDKIKYADREDLAGWAGGRNVAVSWKMDGLTVVLTYDGGRLVKAVTRGNGTEGSVITHNAVFFEGVPLSIPYKGHLAVRGEAVMTYPEFERVNAENGGIYENPRNLASATIQMLDANESRKRGIRFYAFKLVSPAAGEAASLVSLPGEEKAYVDLNDEHGRILWLESLGFGTVFMRSMFEGKSITGANILDVVEKFKSELEGLDYPTDGLVISYSDAAYAAGLGSTGHHDRGSIALKWTDETAGTTVRGVDWSVGKTGVITPVAVFDTVRLGAGSNISRASLHNLSVMRNIPYSGDGERRGKIMKGSRVQVYLANMIIPQIARIDADGDTEFEIPERCPVCGAKTEIASNNGVDVLMCVNPDCMAKHLKRLAVFASKDGANIEGLSESRIGDLVSEGFVRTAADFYSLKDNTSALDALRQSEGWGEKSVANLLDAIEKSRKITLENFLFSLSVPLLGHDLSKKLNTFFGGDVNRFLDFVKFPDEEALSRMEGVGPVKAGSVCGWCREVNADPGKHADFGALVLALRFAVPEETSEQSLEGMTFVITGSVHEYANRDEFRASVEKRGGKVSGSVSAKTDFLVNNDAASTSGKNRKAKELGIPVISEDEFIARFGK